MEAEVGVWESESDCMLRWLQLPSSEAAVDDTAARFLADCLRPPTFSPLPAASIRLTTSAAA
eukprot:684754-Pleurochrysis_carterae.AAC.1